MRSLLILTILVLPTFGLGYLTGITWSPSPAGASPIAASEPTQESQLRLEPIAEVRGDGYRIRGIRLSERDQRRFQVAPADVLSEQLERLGHRVNGMTITDRDAQTLMEASQTASDPPMCAYHFVYPEELRSQWINLPCERGRQ